MSYPLFLSWHFDSLLIFNIHTTVSHLGSPPSSWSVLWSPTFPPPSTLGLSVMISYSFPNSFPRSNQLLRALRGRGTCSPQLELQSLPTPSTNMDNISEEEDLGRVIYFPIITCPKKISTTVRELAHYPPTFPMVDWAVEW